MNEYKNQLKDKEVFSFSCAGICLAAIFVIFNKSQITPDLEYSLYCFCVALPIFIMHASLAQYFHDANHDHDRLHKILYKNRFLALVAIAGYICLVAGIGIIIFSISKIAFVVFSMVSILAVAICVWLSIKFRSNVKT